MSPVPPFREAGAGQPIIFLHGWTMDASVFANQFERLAGDFRCIAPDLPGHGRNGNGAPTVAMSAEALASLLEAEDLRDVILVGWSLGAAVGWHHLANGHAGRIVGMVSVDMSPKLVNDADWTLGLRDRDRDACLSTTARFRNHWAACIPAIVEGMFAERQGPADFPFDHAVKCIASNDPLAMVSMWESLLAADAREAVKQLPVPLLAAHGNASRAYAAATARWLADQAPVARCHTFGASGHSPHLEEPDAFARTIVDFSASL